MKRGRLFGWFLLCCLIVLPSVFAGQPNVTITLTDAGSQVTFDFTLSPGDLTGTYSCPEGYLDVYQNGNIVSSMPVDAATCTGSGSQSFDKQGNNEFYANIAYNDNGAARTLTAYPQISGSGTPKASNLRFMRSGTNIPLTSFAQGSTFLVDILFDIEGSPQTITADLSGISIDPVMQQQYSAISVDPSTCANNGATATCTISRKELTTTDGTLQATFTLADGLGGTYTSSLNATLAVSNDHPEVVFMGTPYCDEEHKCYVKNGINKIIISTTGSQSGFSTKQIFFSLGDNPARITNCTGADCSGLINVQCNEGPLTAYITSMGTTPSQDDAGNMLGGQTSTTLYCDNTKPELIGNMGISSSSGLDIIKSGDTIQIELNISETTKPTVYINFSEFGGGTETASCTQKAYQWTCIASTNVKPGPYTGKLYVDIFDIAHNLAHYEQSVSVLESNDSKTPNIWAINAVQYSPDVFNKKFLAAGDENLYVYLQLRSNKKNAEVIAVKHSSCVAVDNLGNAGLFMGPPTILANYRGMNDVVLNYKLRKSPSDYANYDQLKFTCTLDIYTRWGNVFYTKPDQKNYTFTLRLITTDDVGTGIQREINDSRKRVEENMQHLEQIRSYVNTMYPVCSILKILPETAAPISTTGATLEPFPPTRGVAQTMRNTGDKINGVKKKASDMQVIGQACRFITCDSSINKAIPNLMGQLPGVDYVSKIAGGNGADYASLTDPYKSIFMATLSMCLPAYIQLQDKYNAIECEYQRCLSADVPSGYPINECKDAKGYATCKYYTGAAFEVIPYTALQRNLGNKIKQIMSNPVALAGLGMSKFLCKHVSDPIAFAFCSVPENIKEIKSAIDMYKRWPTSVNGQDYNFCQTVKTNIDQNGYWKPLQYPDGTFSTERMYPPGPLKSANTVECGETVGCYPSAEGAPPINIRYIGTTDLNQNYQVFYDGKYVGTASIDMSTKKLTDIDFHGENAAKTVDLFLTENGYIVNDQVKTTVDQARPYSEEIGDQYSDLALSGNYGEALKRRQELANEIAVSQAKIDAAQQISSDATAQNQELARQNDQAKDKIKENEEKISSLPDDNEKKLLEAENERLQRTITENNKQIQDNTKIIKEKDKEAAENQEDVDKNVKKAADTSDIDKNQKYAAYNDAMKGGGFKLWSKMLETGMAFDYVSRMIPGFNNLIKGYSQFMKNIFESNVMQAVTGDYEDLLCTAKIEKNSPQQGSAFIDMGGNYRNAVHIEGEKSPLIDPDGRPGTGDEYMNYYVSAGVNAKQGGLTFTIYAYGQNTINLTGKITLPDDAPTYPGSQGVIAFKTTAQYGKVCIVFEQSGSELYNYFDTIELNDGGVCNTIRNQ